MDMADDDDAPRHPSTSPVPSTAQTTAGHDSLDPLSSPSRVTCTVSGVPALLCASCRGTKFMDVLRRNGVWERSLASIRENQECPVCRLLLYLLVTAYHLSGSEDDQLVCTLEACQFDQKLYLGDKGVITSKQFSIDIPGLGPNLSMFERKKTSPKLEVMYTKDMSSENGGPNEMARKPVRGSFQPSKLQRWLKECESHALSRPCHTDDHLRRLAAAGRFRVIDVITKQIVASSGLERYCALSYVWGHRKVPPSERVDGVKSPYSLDLHEVEIPKTVADAIELVREIGERYLWVDAFCVDQINPEDRRQIIGAMSSIYRMAWLTIVAAAGSDANDTLIPERESKISEEYINVSAGNGVDRFTLIAAKLGLTETLSNTTWNTRAWTFQEQMLSQRCLYCLSDEVYLDCSHRIFREAYELPLVSAGHQRAGSASLDFSRYILSEAHEKMRNGQSMTAADFKALVAWYTPRKLTYLGDRLDAFAAILDCFHDHGSVTEKYDDQKYAESGIPCRFMQSGLFWQVKKSWASSPSRISTDVQGTRDIPSWSWAGWSGPCMLDYDCDLWFDFEDRCNIVAYPTDSQPGKFWAPWPTGKPTTCPIDDKANVTVHLHVALIAVELTMYDDDDQPADVACDVSTRTIPTRRLGSVSIPPGMFESGGVLNRTPFAMPFHDNGSHVFSMLLVKDADGFYERLSPFFLLSPKWIRALEFPFAGTYEHVRLR